MADEKKKSGIGGAVKGTLLVVGGAIAGAIGGLLFAPQSGEKTRKQIARKIEDTKDQVVEFGEDVKDKAIDLGRDVKKKAALGSDYVVEKKDALVETVTDKFGEIKKKITGK